MKRLILLTLAALLVAPLFGCSWLNRQEEKVWTAVYDLIDTADAKVASWCEKGWLPPPACTEWMEIKAELGDKIDEIKDKWAGLKNRIIDFIVNFLSGKIFDVIKAPPATGGAETLPKRPDPHEILVAAEKAHGEGFLDDTELRQIQLAAAVK